MLYLDSILFTMLRNCGFEKLREALCTDMAESTSSHRHLSLRKETAARPPIERRERAERCGASCRTRSCRRSARVSPEPGHLPPSPLLSLSRIVASSGAYARKSFELPQQVSVAGRRTPSEELHSRASAGPIASSSAPARSAGSSLFAGSFLLTGAHVLTRAVATPP
jgi:hypothetical protein